MNAKRSWVWALLFGSLGACAANGQALPATAPSAAAASDTPTSLRTAENAAAQGPGPDGPLASEERNKAIDQLLVKLRERYVFPEKVRQVQHALRTRRAQGAYEKPATGQAFASVLSAEINQVLHDTHFRVFYSLEVIPPDTLQTEPTQAERDQHERRGRGLNGGIEKVERLAGNIGYLEVRSFGFSDRGSVAAAAAMTLLAQTDALIIDLRRNGGGDPEMVATLCSYFFDESVHLNDIYDRVKNETRQYWTGHVPAGRYLGKDVYVLTSPRTGSGAEEFAYDLQQLKRATIVGEPTWGGANPGETLRLSDHLRAFIPSGRAINPVTKTNWEGTGVRPDISAPADDALRVAHVQALQKALPSASLFRPEIEQALEALSKKPASAQ